MTQMEMRILKNHKLSTTWMKITKLALEHSYQEAYDLALRETDDIYLLRLIMQTGPVINRGGLSETTARLVLQRLNKIIRGGMLYKI